MHFHVQWWYIFGYCYPQFRFLLHYNQIYSLSILLSFSVLI